MRKVLARALIVVSVFTGLVLAGSVPGAVAHDAGGHHCRWQTHTHTAAFYEQKEDKLAEAIANGQTQRAQRIRNNIEKHEHHAHQCDPDNYPPE
jgi:hypothetical protein